MGAPLSAFAFPAYGECGQITYVRHRYKHVAQDILRGRRFMNSMVCWSGPISNQTAAHEHDAAGVRQGTVGSGVQACPSGVRRECAQIKSSQVNIVTFAHVQPDFGGI